MWTNIFSINFGRYNKHKTLKNTPNDRGDQMILFHIYFSFFKNAILPDFYTIKFKKSLIIDTSKQDLSSIWLYFNQYKEGVC